mmetsp:Transcript_16476/g.28581  ORF Transcript_16476/g.28581 Transcript_16476/m.28581 type:complete len:345 (-) Transcript_16476:677-1711(-)|eukprot:CAMPEP_0203754466 /NCGR_PEP_ID=MMETSP0098-20131031/8059_1 /ASSEMBLY_ACC=CAM_ASM_000208 /TAXON_ID=96639 /ORGANISM=" , Strain NY0313808BC1" /LENGTH=344 /DNA_ID=CAMNT_0050645491 /DNA_START=154 /DNA_END=1188 /DNA_ORIENTATION=-
MMMVEEAGPKTTDEDAERKVILRVNWKGSEFKFQIMMSDTMEDLRTLIQMETGVQPENQKIFGLKLNGKANFPDDVTFQLLKPKDNQMLKMMGSCSDTIDAMERAEAALFGEDIVDDFNWDSVPGSETHAQAVEAHQSLKRAVETTKVNIMNPPREGKRLLVLDLDHTLLDFSTRETTSMEQLKRPYMDTFLKSVYKHYDLVVWSQTKWHWVELKLTEMGMVSNPDYAICFALDRTCMFKVTREYKGEERRHEVKALGIIWEKFTHWSSQNTVHIDDLARNFAMNPQSGLKCTAYKRRRSRAKDDCELLQIAAYLEVIAMNSSDFSKLDHSRWREYLDKHVAKR